MQTEVLYTLGKSILDYDPSIPCLTFKHKGFMISSEFRTFLNKALELIKEKKQEHEIFGWVSNLAESDAFLEEDMLWVANDFNPRAYQAGLRYVAFVLTEDEYALANVSAETYTEYSLEEMGEQIVNRNFTDEELAKAWLREVLNSEVAL